MAMRRGPTGWDVVLGGLLVVAGLIVLGHTVLATAVSVLFMGWLTLVAGIATLVAALFRIGQGGFLPTALSGGLITVLGLVFVRNPVIAAVTLTLIAGSLFLVNGTIRLVAAVENEVDRWPLVFGGIVSAGLGVIVLFNILTASLTLLGVLLGVQLVADGITTLLVGRVTARRPAGSGATT